MTRSDVSRFFLALVFCLGVALPVIAQDPPHTGGPSNISCLSCHKMHDAPGGSLTSVAGNANLCMSCHVSGGSATDKPFVSADQAIPAGLVGATAGGSSHRWDSGPQGRISNGSPNTSTGTIIPSGAYTGAYASTIQIRISTAGATGVAKFDWSMTAAGSSTFGAVTADVATSTSATALGSTGVFLAFSTTGTFNLNDIFYLYVRADLRAPVSPAMSGLLENGRIMCSTCHDQHNQVLAPFDPTSSQTYIDGVSNDRHFQRVANDNGAMCGDCHAARDVGKGGTSHPVHVNVASAPNMKTPSASAVLSITGNVECLSCHTVHNAPDSARHAGMLLRASSSTTLCADCHTLADMASPGAHMNPASGMLWPGDQYGGSTYPAYTQPEDRGACMNCHTPHGWPDASNPTQSYPLGLGAQKTNLCMSCHDNDGPSTKNVRAEITKTIHHPTESTSGRTVGCVDCHNPHMASSGVHTYTTTADVDRNRIRAAAGGVLNNAYALSGVDGVSFDYSGLGMWATTTAANYTRITSGSTAVAASGAEFEYQVCFKCHTSYSFGNTPPNGVTSGGGGTWTLVPGSTQPWNLGAGTARFTAGSTAVIGAGTNWTSAMVGMYIRPSGSNLTALRITAVASATALTLSTSTGVTTMASAAYEIRASAAITSLTTVTGYGTAWTSNLANQYFAMAAGGNLNYYRITAVLSPTSLTITSSGTTSPTPRDFYLYPSAGFTTGSRAVVGYGTSWTSALVGGGIGDTGTGSTNVIASVADATHLTLTANFTKNTGVYRILLAPSLALVETDLGQEFNPANRSGHPVVVGLNSYTGNVAPKALAPTAMKAPWATNVGTQTMMCSDCHNTDAASPAAQGPHGSAAQFMLRGANPGNWPEVDVASASSSWCANCHTLTGGSNAAHSHSGVQCWACHVVIPHGSKMSRLLGYSGPGTTMPARYAYKNTVTNMAITGFKKAPSATGYSEIGNCQTTCYHTEPVLDSETW